MAHHRDIASLASIAVELKVKIFQELPDLWSAIQLRQTCREMNTIYLANETRIRVGCRDRIVAIVDDYYSFLTSFYIDESALRRPPKHGWPDVERGSSRPAGDFVLDIVRHLPYITHYQHGDNMNNLEYKCEPMDYSSVYYSWRDDYLDHVLGDKSAAWERFIQLTHGYESGGHSWYFDTVTCDLIVDIVRIDTVNEGDIEGHFEELKGKYRDLTYVPVPGDEHGEIEEEEPNECSRLESVDLLARGEYYGTGLDIKWVRQLYRKFGWPGPNYRKKEALQAIEDYRDSRI